MDKPLTNRGLPFAIAPNNNGGIPSCQGATAAELERAAQVLLDNWGRVGVVSSPGGTPATFVRGMTLGASASGTQFVLALQIEADETELTNGSPVYPTDDQCPVNATVGTYAVRGWSAVQCIELTDPTELCRTPQWSNNFRAAQAALKGADAYEPYVYEVQLAGPFNRGYVAAILWSFQNVTYV